ncbi:MAG: RidA family protein [Ignavibacteriaceae bacterium]|nr:RidA family protein [Ignavibacteriaceae bacterium]
MKRINIPSGSMYEELVGYSRAVRVGNVIEVAGTTSMKDGKVRGLGEPYYQVKIILKKIEQALVDAGGSINDVVRTRIYVVDMAIWEDVARAHGEVFGTIRPASTLVQVSSLVDPDMLVEIEATAILGG